MEHSAETVGHDPCSFSRPNQCLCTNISWFVDVLIDKKILECRVQLEFEVKKDGVKKMVLDTRDLTVHSVTDSNGESLSFSYGEKHKAFGTPLNIDLPDGLKSGSKLYLKINYQTSETASASQFLTPEQTAGKKYPYFFTQCQAIHARSLIPCQDTPCVKTPYQAEVTVPKELVAVMSAKGTGSRDDPQNPEKKIYTFTQKVTIPSYLITIAVGALVSQEVGPRSRVWTEKEMLEVSAWEFAEVEEQLSIAEDLTFDYVWGPYDLLILPPSFPYGGMENPCLTFVTPTLLVGPGGGRPLTDVVAHEISHSWTGNLITNRNWEHFWLNEGYTVFLERKILGRRKGEKMVDFAYIGGWKTLKDQLKQFPENSPLTKLVVELKDTDPDDSFSSVPYEKGSCFLYYLERILGGPEVFEPFLKKYLEHFKFKTVNTKDWKHFLEEYFHDKKDILKQVDWEAWLHKPGLPPVNMIDCKQATESELGSFSPDDIKDFSPPQVVEFLAQLVDKTTDNPPLALSHLKKMDELYDFTSSRNSEIKFRWLRLCVRGVWQDRYPQTVTFITIQGRMKYIRPLYKELYAKEESKVLAVTTFQENRAFYHPIAAAQLAKDLGLE
ncbi:leukotriene A-4 hydrolase [Pocillopora verrucosa]|uniref:leukotriene A-4 hydrolase n=1 Tax=Pocillopora verrucosa TaxID=203993 RepID=UPI00333F85DF